MPNKDKRFLALDGFRGYFVILTFLVHYTPNFVGFSSPGNGGKFLHWLQRSNYGVYGFFILSGFFIGRMLINTPHVSFRKFITHRFLRIYPAFVISLFVSGAIGIYYTHYMKWGWSAKLIVENLLFLNGFFLLVSNCRSNRYMILSFGKGEFFAESSINSKVFREGQAYS